MAAILLINLGTTSINQTVIMANIVLALSVVDINLGITIIMQAMMLLDGWQCEDLGKLFE